MKAVAWLVVAGIGFAVAVWAYESARSGEKVRPISSGMIVASRSSSHRFEEAIPFPAIRAGVEQLPVSGIPAMLGMSAGGSAQEGRGLRFQLSEKLIQVSFAEAGISEATLAWGKLPRMGRNEVLAGPQTARQDQCEGAEAVYQVTGGLPREVGLFARSYVLPASDKTGEHGDEGDPSFRAAVLIPLEPAQLSDREVREQLQKRFPAADYDKTVGLPSVAPQTFYFSLLGEAIFLLGGSGFLIAVYAAAAPRVRPAILRDPLVALSDHRRLSWGVHLAYFGLYLVTAALVYRAPDVWNAMQALIRGAIGGGDRTLEVAGKAYLSGNIARAALTTFVINFFLGSLAFLTLPSCIIPGSGALAAAYRVVLWGILLAPVTLLQSRAMLPHSAVLLLEGEGYILATFFGLMLTVELFRPAAPAPQSVPEGTPDSSPSADSSFWSRYRRGLILNLKGSLLVAIVLAVAAIFEAVEVIWMLKSTGQA